MTLQQFHMVVEPQVALGLQLKQMQKLGQATFLQVKHTVHIISYTVA